MVRPSSIWRASQYLGDPAFQTVWAELNRRKAVVFIHPAKPKIDAILGTRGPVLDYPFDTTRTAVQMVLNSVIARNPDVRIILSHAGGFLPYASHRVCGTCSRCAQGCANH